MVIAYLRVGESINQWSWYIGFLLPLLHSNETGVPKNIIAEPPYSSSGGSHDL